MKTKIKKTNISDNKRKIGVGHVGVDCPNQELKEMKNDDNIQASIVIQWSIA